MQDNDHEQELSKTQIKQRMHDLQEIGEVLVELPKEKLKQLSLPETLHDAVLEARRITAHGGRRRQLQYIGKLMRGVDDAPIRAKLDEWNGNHAEETALLHRLENWRTRLIEDDAALSEFLAQYPDFEVQQLRVLIRNSRKEQQLGKPPKSSRELFRMLREGLSASS
ncbi:MAG TPA: ribosome biogenesis factor YjgA [Novimethylophilus sp.]|jgi:ribosome-associated protein|uniref:ribosome biogenesis factor YjgA n=1 Tax=Novimethylophilus sp. TaxID=2137426 RepID=UPI002F3F95B2